MNKYLVGLLLCFLSFASLSAQIEDSLKQELLKAKADTSKVNLLIELGKAVIDANIDSTEKYAFTALKIANEVSFRKGKMMALNLVGNTIQRRGLLDSAMIYYDQVEKIAQEIQSDKGMGIALSNKGVIHINKGEYVKALELILKAVDYEIKVGDKKGMAEGYLNVGVAHYYMGDLENTLIYFKKSTELTAEIGDLKVLKKGYINIGAIHQHKKEYEEALDYYRRAYSIAEELNDLNDINITLHNMAQIYTARKEYAKAEANYKKALEFHKKFKKQRDIAKEYINLAALYRDQKSYKKAKEHYSKGIKLCEKGGYLKELEDAYRGLAELYSMTSQYEKAYKSSTEYIKIKDSLLNEENARSFAELRTKYETAEKEKLLAEEKSKTDSLTVINATVAKEKAEAELKVSNRTKWVVLLIGLIIAAVSIAMVVIQGNKRKAQAEKDAAIIEERDKGTQAVFQAQEEERKRISKDLHDGIGQQLSGLKMAFQKVAKNIKTQSPEKSKEIEELSNILSQSADEVRSISHQMMPKALTELGLVEALSDMLEKSFSYTEINCEFDHFGIEQRLPEKVEISLYRISQELVNNILKHSGASQVSFQLYKNQDKVILIAEDNGKGIKRHKGEGHGLLNMKSRVNTLNGEINMEPSPSSGTLVTVRIPIA